MASETLRSITIGFAGIGFGLIVGSAMGAATVSDAALRVGVGILLLSIVLMLRSQFPA